MRGANESDYRDLSRVLQNLASIQAERSAHVSLVHHFNANGGKLKARRSIRDKCDQIITVTTDGNKLHTANLFGGLKFHFALERVVTGPRC